VRYCDSFHGSFSKFSNIKNQDMSSIFENSFLIYLFKIKNKKKMFASKIKICKLVKIDQNSIRLN
jgi:hypothetical protein